MKRTKMIRMFVIQEIIFNRFITLTFFLNVTLAHVTSSLFFTPTHRYTHVQCTQIYIDKLIYSRAHTFTHTCTVACWRTNDEVSWENVSILYNKKKVVATTTAATAVLVLLATKCDWLSNFSSIRAWNSITLVVVVVVILMPMGR